MKQLLTLQQLIKVMDPELFRHLEKVEGLNMFFCFRSVTPPPSPSPLPPTTAFAYLIIADGC